MLDRQNIAAGAHQPEKFDVIIVGAGISGIGSATFLRKHCPDLSFAILEALDGYGGTWLIHKYPGTRSDSDLDRAADRLARSDPRLSG